MSLIQEALKRQQQEENGHTKDATTKKPMNLVTHTPPPPPAHAVEPDKNDSKTKSNGSPWRKLIIVLIILFLIITTAAVLIFVAMNKLTEGRLEQVINTYSEKTQNIVQSKQEIDKPTPTQKIITGNPGTETPKPISNVTEKKAVSLEKVRKKPPEKTTIITSPHSTVKWPKLQVTATLAKSGAGQAIINGEFVTVGENIGDVTLIRINGNSVEFLYKNEKKILKVGNSVQ